MRENALILNFSGATFFILYSILHKKMYNVNENSGVSQTYLKSRFLCYGQRHQKYQILLRRKQLNALRQNQEYQAAEFILFLLYAVILGITRIENVRFLQTNGVFKKIVGIKKLPHPTAIRRFLYRLTPKTIRQIVEVHNLIQKKVFLVLHTKTSITFDIVGITDSNFF